MRAAYLIHQQHEDKAKDKGHTNVGVQPGMVVAMLMHSWDFCHLLRLHHVLHLAGWVMLSCDSQANRSGDKRLNMTQSLLSSSAKSLPHTFLDNTQESLFKVFLRQYS